jgi:hypothetical protein
MRMLQVVSHHEQVQAITTLRSEKIADNEVEERKDEQIEILKNPNPCLATSPLETEYELKA